MDRGFPSNRPDPGLVILFTTHETLDSPGFRSEHVAFMNHPVWPPLLDPAWLLFTGMFALAVAVLSAMTTETRARRILGRSIARYAHLPELELETELERAGKTRFYSLTGLAVALLCGAAWRLLLFYGSWIGQLSLKNGHSEWWGFALGAIPAVGMPFLLQSASRWLIRCRLDRVFAERLPPTP
jgi:hypothetical protein